jgi:hypothetical protein
METAAGNWARYQIIANEGLEAAFQVPIDIGQASVDAVDLSSVTSMLLGFQQLVPRCSSSAAQSVFVNRPIQSLPSLTSNTDPMQVVATGAGQLRHVSPGEALPGIIVSCPNGIKATYILETILTGTAFLAAILLPWKRLSVTAVKEH